MMMVTVCIIMGVATGGFGAVFGEPLGRNRASPGAARRTLLGQSSQASAVPPHFDSHNYTHLHAIPLLPIDITSTSLSRRMEKEREKRRAQSWKLGRPRFGVVGVGVQSMVEAAFGGAEDASWMEGAEGVVREV